jgi:outer membrane lipoprotein carrier protein
MVTMNRLFRFLTVTATLLLMARQSGAAAATPKDVVAALEKGYISVSDLQADFTQLTTITSMNREERGVGELFLKKSHGGAMFRFNYNKPHQQIISNGTSIWYYLPDTKQVMVSSAAALFEGGNGIALNYLTGIGHLSTDFTAGFTHGGKDKKGNYVLDLVPRKSNPSLARLQLTVSAEAVDQFLKTGKAREFFPIVSSVVYDQVGNKTRIDFSRLRINRGIGSDRFTFKVPAGVEVIKPK